MAASVTDRDDKKRKKKDKEKERLTSLVPKKRPSKPGEPWTLWLRVGEYDAVPVSVDASQTVHGLKQRLQDDQEFELHGLKLHKMKLCDGQGHTLHPRARLCDVLDEQGELVLHVSDDVAGTLDSDAATALKREIDDLKKQMAQLRTSALRERAPDSSASTWDSTVPSLAQFESIVKKHIGELGNRLDDLESTLYKKNAAMDDSMKQLTAFTSSLKRLGGLPAINNELAPAVGGIPFIKPKETLTGHEGPVWTMARGDQLLFSGSSDTTVKVWDLKSLRAKTLTGHTDIIHCVAATPDDKVCISGSDDRTIKIWDVEQMKLVKSIDDDNIACCLRISHGHLFSGSFKSVKVWNLKKQKQVHILPGHNHWVRALTISSGYLFTGGHNVIKMFDMANFNLARTLTQSCGSIYAIVVQGNTLYAATYENTVLMWDLRTHEYVRSLAGHSGAVYSLAIDENGKKLFSGSYDNSIRVWDLNMYKCLQRCSGHSSSVEALTMVDDQLYSGSTDATIKHWKMPAHGAQQ